MLDPDRPIVLVGDPATAVESRVRLARIGFDKVIGYLGNPRELYVDRPDLVEASSRVTIEQLAELVGLVPGIQLVDVRNPGETSAGTLPGAGAIPLARLVDSPRGAGPPRPRRGQLRRGLPIPDCRQPASPCRFLRRSDLIGGYGAWTAAGLPVAQVGAVPDTAIHVTPMAAETGQLRGGRHRRTRGG